jgi:hypothetical protein
VEGKGLARGSMAGDRYDVQGQQPGNERQVMVTSLRGEKLDRLRAFDAPAEWIRRASGSDSCITSHIANVCSSAGRQPQAGTMECLQTFCATSRVFSRRGGCRRTCVR